MVVGTLVVAASLVAGVKLAVGASSSPSSSGLVIVNGTLVDTRLGIGIYSLVLLPLMFFYLCSISC